MPPTGSLRLATYNVEWFDALFDDEGGLRQEGTWSARHDVTRAMQLEALAIVFRALDADGVMVIEAPNDSPGGRTVRALERFADWAGIRARKCLLGFANQTQQEIAFLYDPDRLSAEHAPSEAGAPRFDTEFAIDLDVDAKGDTVVWSKPPLEVTIDGSEGPIRLMGVHAKSKAPHGAKTEEDALRIQIQNRRKQLAQCIWLRRRVDAHLALGEDLIVMGDFNDGPGLDQFEKLFGRSGVEIVLGEAGATALYDPSAAHALSGYMAARPTTARFWIGRENRYLQALLDYVMVSPGLRARTPAWRIWHPLDDPECCQSEALRDALLIASDHFPVTIELPFAP